MFVCVCTYICVYIYKPGMWNWNPQKVALVKVASKNEAKRTPTL